MDPKFAHFSEEMEVRIGEGKDFTVHPPIYYHSLNEGFLNYFNITKRYKDTYHFAIDLPTRTRQGVSMNFSNKENTLGIILGFHRFFELFIKDLLQRVNPFLSTKTFENESQVIDFFLKKLEPGKVNSIEFSEALKRFKKILSLCKKGELSCEIIERFGFLTEGMSGTIIESIAYWRNRIVHNGNTLPNIYYIDYVMSQHIIPIVAKILDADSDLLKNFIPPYFQTPTGVNILDRFLEINFNYEDFFDPTKHASLFVTLLNLAHLKEFGRATYHYHLNYINGRSYSEPYYENAIGKYVRFAEAERTSPNYLSIKSCPCCGYNTLVVYKLEHLNPFENKMENIFWFNCTLCTYSLKDNLADPHFFAISKEPIFD